MTSVFDLRCMNICVCTNVQSIRWYCKIVGSEGSFSCKLFPVAGNINCSNRKGTYF